MNRELHASPFDSLHLRCKDVVGRRVRLLREIITKAGDTYQPGELFYVHGTWRGRFNLGRSRRADSLVALQVSRYAFEVLSRDGRAV